MTLDIMGVKARQDPANFLQSIKRFGFDKPADFFNRIGEVSHKAVFSWQDVLQQTLERGYMRKGMSQAEATERAAKTFMDYRTPSRVMDQRWMGQALQGQGRQPLWLSSRHLFVPSRGEGLWPNRQIPGAARWRRRRFH